MLGCFPFLTCVSFNSHLAARYEYKTRLMWPGFIMLFLSQIKPAPWRSGPTFQRISNAPATVDPLTGTFSCFSGKKGEPLLNIFILPLLATFFRFACFHSNFCRILRILGIQWSLRWLLCVVSTKANTIVGFAGRRSKGPGQHGVEMGLAGCGPKGG